MPKATGVVDTSQFRTPTRFGSGKYGCRHVGTSFDLEFAGEAAYFRLLILFVAINGRTSLEPVFTAHSVPTLRSCVVTWRNLDSKNRLILLAT